MSKKKPVRRGEKPTGRVCLFKGECTIGIYDRCAEFQRTGMTIITAETGENKLFIPDGVFRYAAAGDEVVSRGDPAVKKMIG